VGVLTYLYVHLDSKKEIMEFLYEFSLSSYKHSGPYIGCIGVSRIA